MHPYSLSLFIVTAWGVRGQWTQCGMSSIQWDILQPLKEGNLSPLPAVVQMNLENLILSEMNELFAQNTYFRTHRSNFMGHLEQSGSWEENTETRSSRGRSKLLINRYRALVLEDKCPLMIGSQQYKYTSYYTFENKLVMCVSYGN